MQFRRVCLRREAAPNVYRLRKVTIQRLPHCKGIPPMFDRPVNSSLAILAGLLLLLGAIVVIGNRTTTQQLARAQAEAYRLAEQLGYTPEAQLTYRVEKWDANLVTGSAKCVAVLYYATPKPLHEFEETLLQVNVGQQKLNFYHITSYIFVELPLSVDGVDGWQLQNLHTFTPAQEYRWETINPSLGENESITLYTTAELAYRLAYKGRHITGNIVAIKVSAGRFPVWRANCG